MLMTTPLTREFGKAVWALALLLRFVDRPKRRKVLNPEACRSSCGQPRGLEFRSKRPDPGMLRACRLGVRPRVVPSCAHTGALEGSLLADNPGIDPDVVCHMQSAPSKRMQPVSTARLHRTGLRAMKQRAQQRSPRAHFSAESTVQLCSAQTACHTPPSHHGYPRLPGL